MKFNDVELKQIARGTFSRVYRGNDGMIYALVPDNREVDYTDYSKEAIAMFASGGANVPQIERLGDHWFPRIGYCQVYRMPEYCTLSGEAKAIAKKLTKIWREFYSGEGFKMVRQGASWYQFSYRLYELIAESDAPADVVESIDSILSACANWGNHYCLEFPLRNMKQDVDGNLVLLDICFNAKATLRR